MTDRLDAMLVFATVCDADGFAAAARKLDLSPSAVTRMVASIEDRLGVRLLQRTTRTMRLTDAGERYLARVRRILAEVEEAELSAQAERAQPRGRLVIAAPRLFGRMHVAPIVSDYLDAFPQTSAELRLSDGMANLVEDGIDVAIRIGDLAESSLVARRLGRTRRVLVASPAYLATRGGPPTRPADLGDHRLIAFDALAPGAAWRFVDLDGDAISIRVDPQFTTNSGDAAIDRALAGGGIASAFCYQVAAFIRAGSLVALLADHGVPPVPIHAVFPTSRMLSANVRALVDLAVAAAPGWGLAD